MANALFVRARAVVSASLIASAIPGAVAAQTDAGTDAAPAGTPWHVGVSVSVPGFRSEWLPIATGLTLSASSSAPGRPGFEVSGALLPVALAYGGVAGAVRTNVTFPWLPAPQLLVVPSVGVTGVGGFARNGAGGRAGVNAGGAIFLLASREPRTRTSPLDLRIGFSRHLLYEPGSSDTLRFWVLEVGLMRRSR
jgi:hypothetical protein